MTMISQADNQVLTTLRQNYLEAWNAGDLDGFINYFTDDVVWMPPNNAPVIGKEACRQSALEWFPELFTGNAENVEDITVDYEEIVLSGDWGYWRTVIPTWGLKGMQILQKQSDGSWKISRYMWNSNPSPSDT